MTARYDSIQHLAWLLREANAYDPEDLATERGLMAEIEGALTITPSDHALERELYDLLKRTVEQRDTGETYDVDRALAEAEGIVGPGGAIEYQYRCRGRLGEWGQWRTWRTQDTMDAPVPHLPDATYTQFRIAPAQPAVRKDKTPS